MQERRIKGVGAKQGNTEISARLSGGRESLIKGGKHQEEE
jgi:hypothetical protein